MSPHTPLHAIPHLLTATTAYGAPSMQNANAKPFENKDKVSRAREERMQAQITNDHQRQVEEIRASMANRTETRTKLGNGKTR